MVRIKSTLGALVPPRVARSLRMAAVRLRYRKQVWEASRAYESYASRYKHPIVFVAGLPKSGTTWIERMLSGYPGYREMMIPEAVSYELEHRGTHDFRLAAQ